MPKNPYPEIYILGAPKCGTTALYYNLANHRDIYDADLKEPNYFSSDFPGISLVSNQGDYLDQYTERGSQKAMDGSACSFYSTKAVNAILKHRPDAKFLIILRNPADMVYSLHGQSRLSLNETEESFEKAWSLSDERWAERDNTQSFVPPLASYKEAGRLGHYTASHLNQIPQEQVHMMLLEDFRDDFRQTYVKLLHFLGIKDDGLTEWARVNEASERKFESLVWFFTSSNGPMGHLKRWAKKTFGLYNTSFMKAVHNATVQPVETKKELSRELRIEILAQFSEDITLLEKVTGRDLNHWRDLDQ